MTNDERYDNSKLAAIISAQGRRQDWLACRIGVSRSYISHMVRGAARITPVMARRLAEALEVSPCDLLDDDPAAIQCGGSRDR